MLHESPKSSYFWGAHHFTTHQKMVHFTDTALWCRALRATGPPRGSATNLAAERRGRSDMLIQPGSGKIYHMKSYVHGRCNVMYTIYPILLHITYSIITYHIYLSTYQLTLQALGSEVWSTTRTSTSFSRGRKASCHKRLTINGAVEQREVVI